MDIDRNNPENCDVTIAADLIHQINLDSAFGS